MPPWNEKEAEGLVEMKRLTEGYKGDDDRKELVEKFLTDVDDEIMLQFLRGRKHKPEYAWETLKKNAEVRLVKYPEMFPEVLPPHIAVQQQSPVITFLKDRDKLGRRIMFVNSKKWDPDCLSLLDMAKYGIFLMDKLIKDEDAITNGIVVIQDSSALGVKHIKQYSVKTIRQLISIYWHSYPIRYKAIYFVNTPYLLSCALSLARYFFPKKLKERLTIWSADSGYTELHKIFPPEMLPQSGGGILDDEDASDPGLALRF